MMDDVATGENSLSQIVQQIREEIFEDRERRIFGQNFSDDMNASVSQRPSFFAAHTPLEP